MITLAIENSASDIAQKRAFVLCTQIVAAVIERGGNAADLSIEQRGSGYAVLATGTLSAAREFGTVRVPEQRLLTGAIESIRSGGIFGGVS